MTAIAKPFAAKDALTVTGAGATGAADVFTISARFAITGTATSPADVYSDSVIVGVEF
jgi:spore coat protein U-like protein